MTYIVEVETEDSCREAEDMTTVSREIQARWWLGVHKRKVPASCDEGKGNFCVTHRTSWSVSELRSALYDEYLYAISCSGLRSGRQRPSRRNSLIIRIGLKLNCKAKLHLEGAVATGGLRRGCAAPQQHEPKGQLRLKLVGFT